MPKGLRVEVSGKGIGRAGAPAEQQAPIPRFSDQA